jgi:hypothetical protein
MELTRALLPSVQQEVKRAERNTKDLGDNNNLGSVAAIRQAAMEYQMEANKRAESAPGLLESAAKTVGFAHLAATQLDEGSGKMLVDTCTKWSDLTRALVSSIQQEAKEAGQNLNYLGTGSDQLQRNHTNSGSSSSQRSHSSIDWRSMDEDKLRQNAQQLLNIIDAEEETEGEDQEDPPPQSIELPQNVRLQGDVSALTTPATLATVSIAANSTLLPEGWAQTTDPTSGLVYYYNTTTGDTSWTPPKRPGDEMISSPMSPYAGGMSTAVDSNGLSSPVSSAKSGEMSTLPDGWAEATDPSLDLTYYYNRDSGETSWERPTREDGAKMSTPPKRKSEGDYSSGTSVSGISGASSSQASSHFSISSIYAGGHSPTYTRTSAITDARSIAESALSAKYSEINNMEHIIAELEASLEAIGSKTVVESTQMETDQLANGTSGMEIDQIANGIGATPENGDKGVSDENRGVEQIDALINDLLRQSKETSLSELQEKNERLLLDIENAPFQSSRSDEIKALEDMVSKLTSNVEKEFIVRQEVLTKKEGIESMLQEKLDDMTTGINSIRDSATQKIEAQTQELKKLEADLQSESHEESTLPSQTSHAETNGSLAEKDEEIQKLQHVILMMKDDIDLERKLNKEASKGRSDLESTLTKKIDELSHDVEVTRRHSEEVAQQKNKELEAMAVVIKKSKRAAGEEAKRSRQLQSELVRVTTEMNDSLNEVDGEIKNLDDSLRSKQSSLSQLQEKNEKLVNDMVDAKIQSQMDNLSRSGDGKALEDASTIAEKEDKLQQIAHLKSTLASAEYDAQTAIDAKNAELRELEKVMAAMRASIDQERQFASEKDRKAFSSHCHS